MLRTISLLGLTLIATLYGCAAPAEHARLMMGRRCDRIRAALERHPHNPKLRRAARECEDLRMSGAQASAANSSPRDAVVREKLAQKCAHLRSLLDRNPQDPKLQRVAQKCDLLLQSRPKESPASITSEAGPAATKTGISPEELEKAIQAAVQSAVQAAQDKPSAKTPSLSSEVDTPRYKKPESPDDFAVVVGIEKYNTLPAAEYAERDAEAVRRHLTALGFPERNVVLLAGPLATKTGLIKNLETWLPNNVSERSTVFFYFSGHGAPDPGTGRAYLVPVDGDPQYLEDTGYPLKRLYGKLGALKARRVIVAMDSCFSGAGGRSVLPKGTRPLVSQIDMGDAGSGNVVSLSASRSDQISGTIEEEGHGLFTYYLLNGLNGAAKDARGSVTVRSLYDYLLPNVQDKARRQNREQVPQLTPGRVAVQEEIILR